MFVPVGDDTFVQRRLGDKVDNARSKIESIVTLLRHVNKQSLMSLLYYCAQPLLQYEMQLVDPPPSKDEHAASCSV